MYQKVIFSHKQEWEQRQEEQFVPRLVPPQKLQKGLIKVVIGPRRAGKSFYVLHTVKDAGYVNFDDERLLTATNNDDIIEAVKSVYGNPAALVFDEIQNLPKWELFVNRMQRQGFDITITGSNSHLLSGELATHLTGRYMKINIFPFSFKEYIQTKKKEPDATSLREMFNDYLHHGGYPEPCIKDLNHKEYLSTLFDAVIYKDIVNRYRIRIGKGLNELATYLLSNVGSEYSFRAISKLVGAKSPLTVQRYVQYLDEVFLLFSVSRFSYKVKEQILANKKVFAYDNGFILAHAFKTSANTGRLYENLVAIALKKQEMDGYGTFYYWKESQTGEEVDFVLKQGTKVTQLIQVCCQLDDEKTIKREVRALLKAGAELRCDDLLILTQEKEGVEQHEWHGWKGTIRFMPVQTWLLQ